MKTGIGLACDFPCLERPGLTRAAAVWYNVAMKNIALFSVVAAFSLAAVAAGAEKRPCSEIMFKEMPTLMLYGDPERFGPEGHPFAKDPTVIRIGGRYLMYYSVCSYPKNKRPKGISKERANWWGAIAESSDLVHWKRVGEIEVPGAPAAACWVAPCAKKFDGKVHLFAQGKKTWAGKPPPNSVICVLSTMISPPSLP